MNGTDGYKSTVALISVTETETAAVMRLYDWQKITVENDEQIRHSFHNTAGLDMESYAVMYAAAHATAPRPVAIVAKSVCDYADSRKSDQYQKFAAFTSCQFTKLLYERFLPLDRFDEE